MNCKRTQTASYCSIYSNGSPKQPHLKHQIYDDKLTFPIVVYKTSCIITTTSRNGYQKKERLFLRYCKFL